MQNVVPAALPITVSVMTGMDVQLVNLLAPEFGI
jgi:hypothetical protein